MPAYRIYDCVLWGMFVMGDDVFPIAEFIHFSKQTPPSVEGEKVTNRACWVRRLGFETYFILIL